MKRPRRRIRKRKDWRIVTCEIVYNIWHPTLIKWAVLSDRYERCCACDMMYLVRHGYQTFRLANDSIAVVRDLLVDSGQRADLIVSWGMDPPTDVVECAAGK